MRLGLTLLLANVVTIVCLVLAYLLAEHDHPGFAVSFIVMAFVALVVLAIMMQKISMAKNDEIVMLQCKMDKDSLISA